MSYYRIGLGRFSTLPKYIKFLLIANFVVFFLTRFLQTLDYDKYITYYDVVYRFLALFPFNGGFYLWQLLTYQFLHANFSHIFFNMLMLWMLGTRVEETIGSKKFLILYLLSGVVGGLLQNLLSHNATTIGSSGAVFGVIVAFAALFPDDDLYLYFIIPIKAKYLVGFIVLVEFLLVKNNNSNMNMSENLVAHIVHLGGAVTGLLFIMQDRLHNHNFKKIFNIFNELHFFNKKNDYGFKKRPSGFSYDKKDVKDADFYDINSGRPKPKIDQAEIDRILDKISQSGYQNLTEKEKRILFEASKHE